ncbi:MAG: RagB/SusD family nutrient uptake outer membrane protein [Prevotella sp.]|nr:RagB/SusD family nutrient uptake outer membrane protein [Prevotella sp.]
MKSIKINILLFGALIAFATACTDDYESLPVDQYTIEYVFSETDSAGVQAVRFLNRIYSSLPSGYNRVGSDFLDAATDDAVSLYMDSDPDVLRLQTGRYTASNQVSSDMNWDTWYEAIRRCNIFINNIDRVPFNVTYTNSKEVINEEGKPETGELRPLGSSYKAEARFLRAFFYFQLLERYGGVPLIGDKVFDINDNLELPRNTFAECVDYIISELDDIQDSLRSIPMRDATSFAHAPSKQACIAFKSRLLLYAASPLFNGKTLEQGNPYVGYTDYDPARWTLAAEVAKDFFKTYGIVGSGSMMNRTKFRLVDNLYNIFINYFGNDTREVIFFRNNGSGTSVERSNGPLGFSGNKLGNGRTNPTQNLVDAFVMKDGKPRGESSYPYDPQKPYENRDPRLDYTVLHQGSLWLNTQLDTYQGGSNNPSGSGRFNQTSYYMGKFMNNFQTANEYSSHTELWVYFRYAEILLNFAEAANESDQRDEYMDDIMAVLQTIRMRAGIEAGKDKNYGLDKTMTREQLREVIHNERRCELAFEEHRYYDIRRWREAETIFQKPILGMQIVKGSNQVVYTPIDILNVDWSDKMYLYPIPYTEVNKNSNMVQNPNWKD